MTGIPKALLKYAVAAETGLANCGAFRRTVGREREYARLA